MLVLAITVVLLGEETALQLDSGWVMQTGDNHTWAAPDFDDSDWQPIEVGTPWEKTGYADYDGYAWYRLKLEIPQEWQNRDEHGFLSLFLGIIDDADVAYFNGEQIGTTGSMPPNYKTGYYTRRFYRLPTTLIKWGEQNILAIRVYDGNRYGGLTKGPYALKMPTLSDMIDIKFEIKNSDGIYFSPNPLPATISIENHSNAALEFDAVFELVGDRIDSVQVIEQKSKTLKLEGKNKVVEKILFSSPPPGFYYVKCELIKELEKIMMFGYEPEKIKTSLTRLSDFEEFWLARKKELKNIAPEFSIVKSDRSTDELDVYLVEMQSYGDVKIRGWYTVPKTEGPHPAILSVPGYRGSMWPYTHRAKVATLALNPRGHGNSKDDIDPQGEEYMFLGFDLHHPEKYIYAGAYMDCLRAVDFLVSRPEIDASRIGVEGGSQGGGLSFATAALDDRIVFCAPDIPWLGDWVGYLQTEYWGWENYPNLLKEHPDLTFSDVNHLLSYFDTMNMAEWIACPVLMSVGLQDRVCPPRTSFAPFNAVISQKEYRVYPFAGHSTWQQHSEIKDAWMAKILGVESVR